MARFTQSLIFGADYRQLYFSNLSAVYMQVNLFPFVTLLLGMAYDNISYKPDTPKLPRRFRLS